MAEFLYKLIKSFFKNDVLGTAAQTAFFLTLSIPPLLALTLSITSNLSVSGSIYMILEFIFPTDISNILGDFLYALPKSKSVTVVSALGAIFSASGSTWALMKGIHKAHTTEKLDFSLKNRFIATVFTVVLALSIVISLGSVIVSSFIHELFETLSKESSLFEISKKILAIGGIYMFSHFLYKFTPGVMLKGKQVFYGALFSAFAWVLVSDLFGTYITNFTRYTTVYGGIGAFFILILWLFVISVIMLLGAQINGALIDSQKSRHNFS